MREVQGQAQFGNEVQTSDDPNSTETLGNSELDRERSGNKLQQDGPSGNHPAESGEADERFCDHR